MGRRTKKVIVIVIILFILILLLSKYSYNKEYDYLMKETKYETPIYYLNNNKKIKIMIIAGIHGNEIGGIKAGENIIEEKYKWANMVIIPRANNEACKLEVRNPYYMSDLNRAFPGNENGTDTEVLANEIFIKIKSEKPDFIIDLHEWDKRFDEDSKLLVNGLILNSIDNKLWKIAEKIYNEYNQLGVKDKLIIDIGTPKGSLNKEISERLNIPVLTIESNMNNPLDERIDFQLYIIENLIRNYEMEGKI